MIRTLFIIAGAALVLCVACLAGAFALGGSDMARNGWAWTLTDEGGETIRIERTRDSGAVDFGPETTRTLAWGEGRSLEIDSRLDVEYVQGAANTVVITGPKALADRVRLDAGRLYLDDREDTVVLGWNRDGRFARSRRDALKVVVTAPAVNRFELRGSGDLTLTAYDQPSLAVAISGSGEIEAHGRADTVDVSIAGSGEADLEALAVRQATVRIAGSGDARVGPSESADISIAGSGDAVLTSRPADVRQRIAGSGDVRHD